MKRHSLAEQRKAIEDLRRQSERRSRASRQTARIARDRKRRAGKTVTVISGLRHDPATLETLLKTLKQQCGAGGTLKDGELEIQGDHRDRVAAALAAMGYKTKMVGG